MKSAAPTICDEVVECIGGARVPTNSELYIVAERIWGDWKGARSAFAWNDLPTEAPERGIALRAAQMALCGS
jgi:hypothetical protein